MENKKAELVFKEIRKLIKKENSKKILVENQFYYNEKAYNYVDKLNKRFFLNSFYDLTNLDILMMIEEAKNIEQVKKQLEESYTKEYANSIYEAFINCLESEEKEQL